MKRNRINHTIIAMVITIACAATAFAHNGIEHVLGTVKQVTASSVTVETVRHETATIALDATTTFSYRGARASIKDLKAGERVAIDTKDDASDTPHAITVKWGATSAAAKATTAPTMDPKMKM